jgi:flagellar protein FliO/FliZ
VLSLVFVGGLLWFAARVAKKRGIGGGTGVIEVVARQRMGRTSSVSVIRIADVVLVVGATDENITLLAEVDSDTVAEALAATREPVRGRAGANTAEDLDGELVGDTPRRPLPRASSGQLAGTVLDRGAWSGLVQELRERTVRR